MPLSLRLLDVDLTLKCKHCGWPLIKNGQWFMVAPRFKCEGCKREVRIPYNDKLVLSRDLHTWRRPGGPRL